MHMAGVRSKKFYEHFFSKDLQQESTSRIFPMWPLRKKPSFSSYGWRESKWCRSCLDNYEYTKSYLSALLDEHEYRFSTSHANAQFLSWVELDAPKLGLPLLGLSDVILPWKVIDPKHRRVDVIEGYRLQFMSTFDCDDPFAAYGSCKRDVPSFVLQHFNAS